MTPATVTIAADELEALRIDAAVAALALGLAEQRAGRDRRATDRGELDRRQSLEDLREVWDRR